MSRYLDLPFVQAKSYGGARAQTQLVVIHATDNTAGASAEASYMSRRTDSVSVHFFADATSAFQVLDTALVAFGCFPTGNSRSVQLELCGLSNQISDAAMRRAAPVVARACAEFAIPVRKVTPAQMRAGERGICGHADVTSTWGEGDHTDPGALFPWSTFITYVQGASSMTGEADAAFVKPYTGIEPWISGSSWMARAIEKPLANATAALARLEADVATLKAQPGGVDVAALAALLAASPELASAIGAQVAASLAQRLES